MVRININFEKEGLENLSTMGKEVRRSVLKDATQDMVRFLMQNSPVDHGLLKSWYIEYMTDDESSIKSPAEYALFQDQGTQAHMIRPVNKKVLYWTNGVTLTTKTFYAGGMMHTAKVGAFSRGHMVSGVKGKHFVEKSFNLVRPRMGGYLAKALERSG